MDKGFNHHSQPREDKSKRSLRMKNLVHNLIDTDTTAIIAANGQSISFKELRKRVGEFAGALEVKGVKTGDRVLLLIPMSIELYVALLALFWVGATVVLVDPSAPLDKILPRFQLKGFIGSAKAHLLRLKFASLRGLDLYVSTSFTPLWHSRLYSLKSTPPEISEPSAPALLTFTTGSTGRPKAIARSHAFLLNQHHTLSHHMSCTDGTIDLPTLPVFLLHSLAGGATCVLADADLRHVGSVDPERIIAQIEREKITSISGSPAFFAPIIRYAKEHNLSLNFLKQVFTGGARVNSKIAKQLCETFSEAEVFVVYGSTESEPIAVLNLNENLKDLEEGERTGRGALVGTPVAEIDVWILDDEVVVTGEHVNKSYYQDPDADSKNKIAKDGKIWHRTGDAGFLDEQGRIWLLGRIGTKVDTQWPMPIEAQAECLHFVDKAAFIEWEQRPLLVVECSEQPENWIELLDQICDNVRVIRKIPVDPRHMSKINRQKLQEYLSI